MCISGAFGVCRIGHKREHASVSEFSESCKIDRFTVNRSVIHLEITGMHDYSRGSMDSHTYGIGYRVIYFDEFHGHTSHFYGFLRLYHNKFDFFTQSVFL